MAYFADLSPYCYSTRNEPLSMNVGWLERRHHFETMAPSEDILELLWCFCSTPVRQTRGFHQCDLCPTSKTVEASRNGSERLLGTAEIRVFARRAARSELSRELGEKESGGIVFLGQSTVPVSVYAAPTMIYHYVGVHHYKPPEEFLSALQEGPRPPSQEYFDLLNNMGLRPTRTSSISG